MKLTLLLILLCWVAAQQAPAQNAAARQASKPVIFAVLNDGKMLEPIAYWSDKKLESAIDGAAEQDVLAQFHKSYFKPKAAYQLIFGGLKAGTATVVSSDPGSECVRHTAVASVTTTKTPLKGNVMALAVPTGFKTVGNGTRRLPTAAERKEMDALVRAEMQRRKVIGAATKPLKYKNLTAVDVDADGVAEFVGSYWIEPTAKSRALLFFIATKSGDGRYTLAISELDAIKEADTMSNDITSVDTGVGHELLIDLLDIDSDGVNEIFTYVASFEGAGFHVYKRSPSWSRVYEGMSYRCGF
jgi:hypothetical protein